MIKECDLDLASYKLDTPVEADVINPSSYYCGESFYITHKAHVEDKVWYKAYTDYEPSNALTDLHLWFAEDELEFLD